MARVRVFCGAVVLAALALSGSAETTLPAFRASGLSAARLEALKRELPVRFEAATNAFRMSREALATAVKGGHDAVRRKRFALKLEAERRAEAFVAGQLAAGDPTSLFFAESGVEDLREFARWADEERTAWLNSPDRPGAEPKVFRLADFGAKGDGVADDAPAFAAAIAAVRRLNGAPSRIEIPEGRFRLNSKCAYDSNVLLLGVTNCSIRGVSPERTKLVFAFYEAKGFQLWACDNVTLANVELMTGRIPFFQGTLLACDKEAGWFEVRHDPGSLAPDDPQWKARTHPLALMQYTPEGHLHLQNLIWWDRTAESLGGGRYRMRFKKDIGGWKEATPRLVGEKVTIPDRWSAFCAMAISWCRSVTLENVWCRSSRSGFCGIGSSRHVTAYRCRVFPQDGFVMSTNADGFYNSRGSCLIDCDFANLPDDGCNSVLQGQQLGKVDGRTLYHHLPRIRPGAFLQVLDSLTGEYRANLHVVAVGSAEALGQKWYTATVAEDLPCDLNTCETVGRGEFSDEERLKHLQGKKVESRPPDFVFEPCRDGTGFVVSGCRFGDIRNTGIVVQCPNSIIENCTAERVHNGINVSALMSWYEGPPPYNVLVRGCTFRDNWNAATAVFQAYGRAASVCAIRGLVFERNTFARATKSSYALSAADKPVLRDNIVTTRPLSSGKTSETP